LRAFTAWVALASESFGLDLVESQQYISRGHWPSPLWSGLEGELPAGQFGFLVATGIFTATTGDVSSQ